MRQNFEIFIRQMCPEDAAAAAEIERSSFSSPWSVQGFLDALDNPNTWCIAAFSDVLAGYCILYLAADEAEIATIAVAGPYRGSGIADAMLTYIKEQMPKRGIGRILLDVRPSNRAARALYEKHGFQTDGRRKNFYSDPREDAVLMSFDKGNIC